MTNAAVTAASFRAGASDYPLRHSFILDSGSTIHITNNRDRISNLRSPTPADCIWAVNSRIWIRGYGTLLLNLSGPKGTTQLRLRDVAWCPDILCNLISFRLLKQQGIWWDTKSEPTTLKDRNNNTIANLTEAHGQWILEHQDTNNAAFLTRAINSRTKRPVQKADAVRWHKRLGHPGPAALERLVQQSEGVRIKGVTTVQCNACGKAKSKRQVRRTPRVNDQGPGERLAIDFHAYEEGSSTKEKSQMLVTDRYSGFLWDFYFKDNRLGKTIIGFLDIIVLFLKKQYNVTVKVIECDGEIATTKPEVSRWCTARSI